MNVIVFNGNSVEKIIADAKALGVGGENPRFIIITRKDDRLAAPEEYRTARVDQITEFNGDDDIVIANGGTTAQQIPLVLWAAKNGHSIIEITRDREIIRYL